MLKLFVILSAAFIFFIYEMKAKVEPWDFAVQITVNVIESPAGFNLTWVKDSNAVKYIISRKLKTDSTFQLMEVLGKDALSWSDFTIEEGKSYAYKVEREANFFEFYYDAFGYVNAGINVPAEEYRGKILVLVDYTVLELMPEEIENFKKDLIGAGWEVEVHFSPRAEEFNPKAVQIVKQIIKEKYTESNGELRTVLLIGRVPVAYSGTLTIDGHTDHVGAWPAQPYYADMDGVWTDTATVTFTPQDKRNINLAFDGKFDQHFNFTGVELEIGRIDFYGLPDFKESEMELLKRYFRKNHEYRHKKYTLPEKGAIADRFGVYGKSKEATAANAFSAFSSLFGFPHIDQYDAALREKIKQEPYLFTFMSAPGSFNSVEFLAYSFDYAVTPVKAGFMMFFGSYNADWDAQNSILRSALAADPYPVISLWAGRPYWHLHHMAMGETIGYSTKITMNNNGFYDDYSKYGRKYNHMALMGDPTLKLHIVAPPEEASATKINGSINVSWKKSADDNVTGYNIYKAESIDGKFKRLNDEPVDGAFFIDEEVGLPGNVYMIRAVALQKSATGTYYNLSQGAFAIAGQ